MYGYKKQVNMSYDEAINKAKEELKKEGFGVLTEIDVKAKLKEKLDVDFDKYIILGACSPAFAHKALLAERDIGLLMPCNVIVYEDKNKVFVSTILPTQAMSMIDNKTIKRIAETVEEKLKKVIENIKGL